VSQNIYEMNAEQLMKADISTQERIRLLFRLGFRRSAIAKMVGVKYQVVFKATNPKYAPVRWQNVLSKQLAKERATREQPVEEVPELTEA
jgi:hypothetical protein